MPQNDVVTYRNYSFLAQIFKYDAYWPTAVSLMAELHIFTIFSNHALCFPLQCAICICAEFQVCHGVKQLGQVSEIEPHSSYFEAQFMPVVK